MIHTKLHTARNKLSKIFRQSYDSISKSLKNIAHRLQVSSSTTTPIRIITNNLSDQVDDYSSDSFSKSPHRNELVMSDKSRNRPKSHNFHTKSEIKKHNLTKASKSSEELTSKKTTEDLRAFRELNRREKEKSDIQPKSHILQMDLLNQEESNSPYQSEKERILRYSPLRKPQDGLSRSTEDLGLTQLNVSLGLQQTREDIIFDFPSPI